MKKIYLLLVSTISAASFAQTTITKAANDYVAPQSINSTNVIGTPNNSASGSGVTFDNSLLTSGTSVVSLVSIPSAGEITSFPGTTVKFEDGNGNSLFYKSSATLLEITGASISGATLSFSADNALFLKFPTSFPDTYTDNARGSFTNGTVSGLFRGTITTTADATGTLLLSGSTYNNILRVKTVQNYNLYQTSDTNYLFAIGSIISTIYTYYDNFNRYPIFTATTATISVPLLSINQTTNAAVRQENPVLASSQSNLNKIQVYPNPVKDYLFLAGDLKNYSGSKIYSLEGKLLMTSFLKDQKIDLTNLPTGNYILELNSSIEKPKTFNIIKK